jgi:putative ABC transport system ATP-binding protein
MCLDAGVIFSRLDMRETACPWVSTPRFYPNTFTRFKAVRGQGMEHALDTARSGQEIAVRCRGLTKTYGTGEAKVMALRGVDLEVRLGELLMLVGPSGCGKTTLISIIAAILNQDSGGCEVFGQELQRMNQRQRTRFRGVSIGFVFQLFNLLPALSAIENVSVPLLINSVSRTDAESRASQLLTEIDLGGRLRALPAELSGGQQQRVAIARALVHHPKLIVCDEPTSNLDHDTGRSVMNILRDLAKSPDRALIVVTHDPRIFEFADRIAHMDDGKITEITDQKDKVRLQ